VNHVAVAALARDICTSYLQQDNNAVNFHLVLDFEHTFTVVSSRAGLQPGSTGIVHIGTMEVDPSGPTVEVPVKLAFTKDEKSRLKEEHRMYSLLHSKGVHAIPRAIFGLYVANDQLCGSLAFWL